MIGFKIDDTLALNRTLFRIIHATNDFIPGNIKLRNLDFLKITVFHEVSKKHCALEATIRIFSVKRCFWADLFESSQEDIIYENQLKTIWALGKQKLPLI